MGADEPDVDLAGVPVGVVVEVDARGEVAAALGDLEVAVHIGLAGAIDVGRDRQQPAVIELGRILDGFALAHGQLLVGGGPALGEARVAPLPEPAGEVLLPAVPGVGGQRPQPPPGGVPPD